MDRESIAKLKYNLKPGTRIQLSGEEEENSKSRHVEKGTVEYVDDAGKISINMDSGENIVLDPEKTAIKRLHIDDQIEEAETLKNNMMKEKQRGRDNNSQDRDEKELNM